MREMREVKVEKTKIPTSEESDRARSPTQVKLRGKSPSVLTCREFMCLRFLKNIFLTHSPTTSTLQPS